MADLWSKLFTKAQGVLVWARSYFTWAVQTHVLHGIGLCLFFASQGAGKVLWSVLAGSIRLLVIVIGGWWFAATHAPARSIFALAGTALAAYGIATALAVYWVPWGKR